MKHAILIVSHEIIGDAMAGPGIRYYNFARVLAREFDVTLAAPRPSTCPLTRESFAFIEYDAQAPQWLTALAAHTAILILPSILAVELAPPTSHDPAIVIDGYDPLVAEWLAASAHAPHEQDRLWAGLVARLAPACVRGDFFLCASERQRDWWLGQLDAYGRINPFTFRDDVAFRRLLDVVPFGLPDESPRHTRTVIKGVWQGITENDRVILWGGGLWQWLDPLTAIRAMAQVWQQRQDVRLVFPGTRHPNPAMLAMPTHTDAARALAQELGLLNRAVFFGEWIPYADWQNVLLESDLALTLHAAETLETRLAFRSRVLDYFWAGVPVIATRGDATSELIERHQLGVLVDAHEADAVARAMLTLLAEPHVVAPRCTESVRAELTWERVAQPLIEFCHRPHPAPDRVALGERVGQPYYLAQIQSLRDQIAQYQNRRAVRFAEQLNQMRLRLR